jgi:long-chain acyl-CoA synthetase
MPFQNLGDLFCRQAAQFGPRTALRYKQHGLYGDLSWDAYHRLAQHGAWAWTDLGIRPGDRVGILSENRYEWLVADLSILMAGAADVPLHAPLTAPQVQYQLAHSGARWVVASTVEQLAKIVAVRSQLPDLEGVVSLDRRTAGQSGEPPGLQVLVWDQLLARGARASAAVRDEQARRQAAQPAADLATIIYTSGTTGEPKGVMLTHGNLLSNAEATCAALPPGELATLLSWLPYSHIYARLCDHYVSILAGSVVALAEGMEHLKRNLLEIEPTHMTAVPRFYEKVWDSVAELDAETRVKRLRSFFGRRLRWASGGGAPLPPHIARGFVEAGVPLLQGYGLTESSPVISTNTLTHNRVGSVGRAIPGVEVRIADDGEILSRGPHIMQGYWRKPEATADAIRDGWLHTGDLGRLDDDGYLWITGRKKDLIVLSNGKKVVPSHIESLLLADPLIDQVVVAGDHRPYLTAVIVLNGAALREAARRLELDADTAEDLVASREIVALLERRVAERLEEVSPPERVRRFLLLAEPFTIAADELTPTMKVRRQQILARHEREIEALYARG